MNCIFFLLFDICLQNSYGKTFSLYISLTSYIGWKAWGVYFSKDKKPSTFTVSLSLFTLWIRLFISAFVIVELIDLKKWSILEAFNSWRGDK